MIETFDKYQAEAEKTAIYPMPILYPILGLCGEAGEVAEKISKAYIKSEEFNYEAKNGAIGELGDTLWYITNLAKDLSFSLKEIANQNIDDLFKPNGMSRQDVTTFRHYERFALTKMPPGYNALDGAMDLNIATSKIVEKSKKVYRDYNGIFIGNILDELKALLGEALFFITQIADYLLVSLSDVATANIEKLNSRQKRGMLGGNGDNR